MKKSSFKAQFIKDHLHVIYIHNGIRHWCKCFDGFDPHSMGINIITIIKVKNKI
jgi:hypothetical protein